MHFTKKKNIPGVAIFLDFEKAFDSIEWNFIYKYLETFNFGLDHRQWIKKGSLGKVFSTVHHLLSFMYAGI